MYHNSAPDHFDASTIARDAQDNWALKSSNLRKLVRNLQMYYHDELGKTPQNDGFADVTDSISDMARNANPDAIAPLVELICAAAVSCDDRAKYVGWIMNMSESNQVVMKEILQESMERLEEYDGGDEEDSEEFNDSEEYGDDSYVNMQDGGFMSDEEGFEGEAEMNGLFRNAMATIDTAMDTTLGDEQIASPSASSVTILRERDELRAALAGVKRELAAQKSQSATLVEDSEVSHNKLRALAEDLQERLERRETELSTAEEGLLVAKRDLEDAEAKVSDLAEKNSTLADELDIATAKANQLRKAEATVVAYRKKLEGVGVMNQQMTDLEDQSAKYLGQIMELEMETKKVPELQKNLEEVKRDLGRAEKEKVASIENLNNKTAEVSKLKADLSASNNAKKMYEEELVELRSMQNNETGDIDVGPAMAGLSLTSAQSVSEVKEKVMRLEIENNTLKKKLETAETTAQETVSKSESGVRTSADVLKLQEELDKKNADIKKLAAGKVKLEEYTKRTLAKFQEKYLVALQDCKAKLKEKHDKIEQLEARSAAEKSNQKKEEKLLSSTIYELGLTIMQQRLKEGR